MPTFQIRRDACEVNYLLLLKNVNEANLRSTELATIVTSRVLFLYEY